MKEIIASIEAERKAIAAQQRELEARLSKLNRACGLLEGVPVAVANPRMAASLDIDAITVATPKKRSTASNGRRVAKPVKAKKLPIVNEIGDAPKPAKKKQVARKYAPATIENLVVVADRLAAMGAKQDSPVGSVALMESLKWKDSPTKCLLVLMEQGKVGKVGEKLATKYFLKS